MGNSASSDRACEKEIIREADEENEEADGEGDVFVSLKNKISKSQKMDSECFNHICEIKEYICEDLAMKKLVRDYIDNSLETSKFFHELSESLKMEKARHIALAHALQNPSSETPQMVLKYITLNYFTDIDSKISRAMSAAAGVLKGLGNFLGPSPAAAAVHFRSETIEFCNARIVKYLNQCKANTIEKMDAHTSARVSKLKNTGELVIDVKGDNRVKENTGGVN